MKPETYNQKPEAKKKRSLSHASCFTFHERGITIYLAVIALSAALATALFVAGSLAKEYRISSGLFNSLKAVYIADSVLEYTLYQVRAAPYDSTTETVSFKIPDGTIKNLTCLVGAAPDCSSTSLSSLFANSTLSAAAASAVAPAGSTFSVKGQLISNGTGRCATTAQNCVYLQASGGYSGANRAIEIIYENK